LSARISAAYCWPSCGLSLLGPVSLHLSGQLIPMNILLLTEEPMDQMIFRDAVAGLSSHHTLVVCDSIGNVWEKLKSRQIAVPNIIFLHIELSRSYDHELVEIFKRNPHLKSVPIVVLADTVLLDEISYIYGLQISCFVTLPQDPIRRRDKFRACLEFWSVHAELPELQRWWPKDPDTTK